MAVALQRIWEWGQATGSNCQAEFLKGCSLPSYRWFKSCILIFAEIESDPGFATHVSLCYQFECSESTLLESLGTLR